MYGDCLSSLLIGWFVPVVSSHISHCSLYSSPTVTVVSSPGWHKAVFPITSILIQWGPHDGMKLHLYPIRGGIQFNSTEQQKLLGFWSSEYHGIMKLEWKRENVVSVTGDCRLTLASEQMAESFTWGNRDLLSQPLHLKYILRCGLHTTERVQYWLSIFMSNL